jgi:transposase-like protein
MRQTQANDTEIVEMMQVLMNEGMQGFPSVMARLYNLAMRFERELHLGAARYERSACRTGYANGYKPKTVRTATGKLIPTFPNTDSLMRLVSAICAEMSDEWECSNYKYMSAVNKL